jgi:hypothetical protein
VLVVSGLSVVVSLLRCVVIGLSRLLHSSVMGGSWTPEDLVVGLVLAGLLGFSVWFSPASWVILVVCSSSVLEKNVFYLFSSFLCSCRLVFIR